LERLAGHREWRISERRTDKAGVHRHGLAGGAHREQFEERSHFLARRNNFLDARDGDVHGRSEAREADIAFAFDEHEGAGVGGDEIGPGDADVGVQKFMAQDLTGKKSELFTRIERKLGFEFSLEERGNALATVMQGRRKNVRRLLIGKLKNKFGEIAFDDFNAVGLKNMIEVNFLARHALALYHHFRGAPPANVEYVTTRIGRGVGDEYVAVVRTNGIFQRLDEIGKIRDRLVFDATGFVFQGVIVGQIGGGAIAAFIEMLCIGANGRAFDVERHADCA
jgi:hypothetical protein